MKNKRFSKSMQFFKRERCLIIATIIILVFPLIVGIFYSLPIPQIIRISTGDLLAFYGTSGGILFSFWTYRHEKAKELKQREKELKPQIMVELVKQEGKPLFEVSIRNLSDNPLLYIWLYETTLTQVLTKKITVTVSYSLSAADTEKYNPDYNICSDENILDKTGYPKYVQILCEDYDGNTWNCCFHKVNGFPIYYYPDIFEII